MLRMWYSLFMSKPTNNKGSLLLAAALFILCTALLLNETVSTTAQVTYAAFGVVLMIASYLRNPARWNP